MTTETVAILANTGDLASADFPLQATLRRAIVPEFLEAVGNVGWRRRRLPIPLAAGARFYDMPDEFNNMERLYFETTQPAGGAQIVSPPQKYPDSYPEIPFIGNEFAMVAQAEANTTPGTPGGFYLSYSETAPEQFKRVKFTGPADQDYSLIAQFYLQIPFADDTSSVDFNKFVPSQYQWALVDGLKRDIFLDRYGVGDSRFQAQAQRFQASCLRAREGDYESARHNRPRFMT